MVGSGDPGDDVQRRFRYQHAYAVILLASAYLGERRFRAVWCEHHDDILGQRIDGKWDCFQVKTQRSDIGPIRNQTPGFKASLKKFVTLEERFGEAICSFNFVSNVRCLDSKAKSRLANSPVQYLHAAAKTLAHERLEEPFATVLRHHAEFIECSEATLFLVLTKLELIHGPELDAYGSVLSHEHLRRLPRCEQLAGARLDAIRDELIQLVYSAASMARSGAARHLYPINAPAATNPQLLGKRLPIETVDQVVKKHSHGAVVATSGFVPMLDTTEGPLCGERTKWLGLDVSNPISGAIAGLFWEDSNPFVHINRRLLAAWRPDTPDTEEDEQYPPGHPFRHKATQRAFALACKEFAWRLGQYAAARQRRLRFITTNTSIDHLDHLGVNNWFKDALIRKLMAQTQEVFTRKRSTRLAMWRVFLLKNPGAIANSGYSTQLRLILEENRLLRIRTCVYAAKHLPEQYRIGHDDFFCVPEAIAGLSISPQYLMATITVERVDHKLLLDFFTSFAEHLVEAAVDENHSGAFEWNGGYDEELSDALWGIC